MISEVIEITLREQETKVLGVVQVVLDEGAGNMLATEHLRELLVRAFCCTGTIACEHSRIFIRPEGVAQ